MRTETLAIVFTDIKGFTAKTSAQSHAENAAMLKTVDTLVAPVVRGFSGRVVKSIGDAYMVVFRSPTDAVRCAAAILDRIHIHNKEKNSDLHLRIAINIGEVRMHRGDVFGEPVNIAARIEGLTPADEIYLSEAVYLTMNRSEVSCTEVGQYELKGIPEPVTLYRVDKHHEGREDDEDAPAPDDPPFGGREVHHWQRMRMVRPAYMAMWIVSICGLLLATYLRYRPGDDYQVVLLEVQKSIERQDPLDAIARARLIPPTAGAEHLEGRRLRRTAVTQLIKSEELEPASRAVERLLEEKPDDLEARILEARILWLREDFLSAFQSIKKAIEESDVLLSRETVREQVLDGLKHANTRVLAQKTILQYYKDEVAEELAAMAGEEAEEPVTRRYAAGILDKLGLSERVDWVALALVDLKSASCRTRKTAIAELLKAGDTRAVAPLEELASSKSCGSYNARKAAAVLKKGK